jgi:hypothetical protein
LVDPINSSSLKFVNNRWSDYNKCTNVPFVYQSSSLEYHELVKDQDVDDNYDPSILEWVYTNYPKTLVYHDAQVNVFVVMN